MAPDAGLLVIEDSLQGVLLQDDLSRLDFALRKVASAPIWRIYDRHTRALGWLGDSCLVVSFRRSWLGDSCLVVSFRRSFIFRASQDGRVPVYALLCRFHVALPVHSFLVQGSCSPCAWGPARVGPTFLHSGLQDLQPESPHTETAPIKTTAPSLIGVDKCCNGSRSNSNSNNSGAGGPPLLQSLRCFRELEHTLKHACKQDAPRCEATGRCSGTHLRGTCL